MSSCFFCCCALSSMRIKKRIVCLMGLCVCCASKALHVGHLLLLRYVKQTVFSIVLLVFFCVFLAFTSGLAVFNKKTPSTNVCVCVSVLLQRPSVEGKKLSDVIQRRYVCTDIGHKKRNVVIVSFIDWISFRNREKIQLYALWLTLLWWCYLYMVYKKESSAEICHLDTFLCLIDWWQKVTVTTKETIYEVLMRKLEANFLVQMS